MMIRQLKYFLLLGAVAAVTGWPAHGQDWKHDNRQHDESADRAYRDGYTQGRRDRAASGRHDYRGAAPGRGNPAYRDAYRRGYEAGYSGGNSRGYGSSPNVPGYGGRGSSGNYSNQAYSQGMRDGQMDGQHDRATGHSFRPTEGDNYKDADRGYSSSLGNKETYKLEYRNGYMSGYERGYGR